MIAEEGLAELKRLGFSIHVGRSDHMLMLNADGSCVYRGYIAYVSRDLWTVGEEQIWDGFSAARLRDASGFHDERSWYVFQAGDEPLLQGPYSNTNAIAVAGTVCKNRWSQWELLDGHVRGRLFRDEMADELFPAKYRYQVVLRGPLNLSRRELLVGGTPGNPFLWSPAIDDPDSASLAHGRMVVFRRLRGGK